MITQGTIDSLYGVYAVVFLLVISYYSDLYHLV